MENIPLCISLLIMLANHANKRENCLSFFSVSSCNLVVRTSLFLTTKLRENTRISTKHRAHFLFFILHFALCTRPPYPFSKKTNHFGTKPNRFLTQRQVPAPPDQHTTRGRGVNECRRDAYAPVGGLMNAGGTPALKSAG